jgi:hypothetical protein
MFICLHRILKVYESESYDYPVQIQESITQLSTSIGHGITNFAATNLKGTSIPTPQPVAPSPTQHKTLPHAIGRAATNSAATLQKANQGGDDKLTKAMAIYAGTWEKVRKFLHGEVKCPTLKYYIARLPVPVSSMTQPSVRLSCSRGKRHCRRRLLWL